MQGDALTSLLSTFALVYTVMKSQENKRGLELNGTDQLLVSADNANLLAEV
jgi:hypothetical protein